jgi:hypothetical protein
MKYRFEKLDDQGKVVTVVEATDPEEFRSTIDQLLPRVSVTGWVSTTTMERLNKTYESVKDAGMKLIEEAKKFGDVEDVGRKYHIALFRKKNGGRRKRFAVLEVRKSKIHVLDGDWDTVGISATIQTTSDVNQELINKLRELYEQA